MLAINSVSLPRLSCNSKNFENVYEMFIEGVLRWDQQFFKGTVVSQSKLLLFISFSLHKVNRECSLNGVVSDEEVQGKGDVGASKDPP